MTRSYLLHSYPKTHIQLVSKPAKNLIGLLQAPKFKGLTSICNSSTIVTLTGSISEFSLPTTVAETTVEATSNSSADLLSNGYRSEKLNMENTMLVSLVFVSLMKMPGGSIISTVSSGRSLALTLILSSKLWIEMSRSRCTLLYTFMASMVMKKTTNLKIVLLNMLLRFFANQHFFSNAQCHTKQLLTVLLLNSYTLTFNPE